MSALMTETPRIEAFLGLPPDHALSMEDLALLPDDGRRYEIIDGSLHVSPAPTFGHQRCSAWLLLALAKRAPTACIVVEGANVLLPAPRTRLLVPDVLAVRLPGGRDLDDELTLPPDVLLLVVEVVSPSSTTMDRLTKPALYAEAGIPNYWRVERGHNGHTVHIYRLTGGTYTQTHEVQPGEQATLDHPWAVTLAPPRRQ